MIPKNTSRIEQFEKNSGAAKHCNNLLDAVDTQNVAPPRQKELTLSSAAPGSVLDKPCMCFSLSCFVLFFIQYFLGPYLSYSYHS